MLKMCGKSGEEAEAVISVLSAIPHLRKLSLLYIPTLTFMISYQELGTRQLLCIRHLV